MHTPAPRHESTVARTFFALGSGDASARVIAFAAFVYLARVLGAEAFGTLELAAAIVLYGSRLVDLGFEIGLGVRETAAGDEESRSRLVGTGLAMRLASAVVVIALTAGLGLLFLPPAEGRVLALYALTLLAVGLGTRWVHLGFERSRVVALARVLGEVTMVTTVLVFVRSPDDLLRVPLARFGGDMLTAALLLIGARLLIARRPRIDRALARSLIPRALPLVGSSLFGLMIFNADLIFLRVFEGRAAVGHYAAAYALTSFLSNMGIAYSLSLLPALTRLRDRAGELGDLYRTAHAQVFTVGVAVAAGGTLLAAPVVSLVFGPEYRASVLPLAIVIWAVPVGLVRDLPVTALISAGRERPIVRLTGQAAAINMALNLLLVPSFGLAGAATATVLTEIARWRLAARASRPRGLRPPPPTRYIRGLAAALAMAAVLYLTPDLALWARIPLGVAVWVATLAAVGAIRRIDGGRPGLSV